MGLLALHESGLTYSEIAARVGISRNAVAGAIHRERYPATKREAQRTNGGFRDLPAAMAQADLADAIGLVKAASLLGMDKGHLCRVRQRVRAYRAAMFTTPARSEERRAGE